MPRVNRIVKRNIERALKARGLREKKREQVTFTRGFNMGSDMMRLRVQNATAGMEYGYEYEVPKAVEGAELEVAREVGVLEFDNSVYRSTDHTTVVASDSIQPTSPGAVSA